MRSLANLWWRIVQFGFRLLYNELAFTYDAVSWIVSLGDWHRWQQSTLKFIPPKDSAKILEIAHGTGGLHAHLLKAGYDVIGCDLSPAMGRITRNRLTQQGLHGRLLRCQAQVLPFADQSFTTIISTFPTDFVTQPQTLREVHRVLHDGGEYIIVLGGDFTANHPIVMILNFLYHITGQKDADRRDVSQLFAGHGFDVRIESVPYARSVAQLVILTKSA